MVCEQGPPEGLGKEKWEMQLREIKYSDAAKHATTVLSLAVLSAARRKSQHDRVCQRGWGWG